MTKPSPRWRVGDLARMTGLTVRTLHHYEEIGLLGPAARGEGGHRLYDEASVERLYRIRVLRDLGVPLAGIQRLVDDGSSIGEVMRAHLARVEAELAGLAVLRDRLRGLVDGPGGVDADALLRTLDAMSRLERHVDAGARPDAEALRAWDAIRDDLRASLEAGDDPTDPRVREVAIRAHERLRAFAGGDEAVLAALAHLRAHAPPAAFGGWDPPLFAYLDRALRALEKEDAR